MHNPRYRGQDYLRKDACGVDRACTRSPMCNPGHQREDTGYSNSPIDRRFSAWGEEGAGLSLKHTYASISWARGDSNGGGGTEGGQRDLALLWGVLVEGDQERKEHVTASNCSRSKRTQNEDPESGTATPEK